MCLTAHGAYGCSYVERTRKLLDVCIIRGPYTNEMMLFSRRYKFVGSDLWADAKWNSTNAVTLFVYDYGNGVSEYDARAKTMPSNHIATLYFVLNIRTGKYEEKK